MPNARSYLVLGPTGAGKSSFIRTALKALGSGAIALAPGEDEINSYSSIRDNPAFLFKGFDDPLFYPSLKESVVEGHAELLRWQKKIFLEVKEDIAAGKPPRYAAYAMDTATALGTLAYNATLVKSGRDTPPAAQSPDGAFFYTLLKQKLDEMFHIPRALKGLGVHWIAVGHVNERDTTEVSSAAVETKTKSIVAAIPGGYRDILPSFFDVVLHAGVATVKEKDAKGVDTLVDKHYLQWRPSAKRPTKSRFGSLSPNVKIPNNWKSLNEKIDAAIAEEAEGEN